MSRRPPSFLFFFFNDTATTEIYTLSLHDALPILSNCPRRHAWNTLMQMPDRIASITRHTWAKPRSEEHTSELQSHLNLVCRLLLEKKKTEQEQSIRLPCTPHGQIRWSFRPTHHSS